MTSLENSQVSRMSSSEEKPGGRRRSSLKGAGEQSINESSAKPRDSLTVGSEVQERHLYQLFKSFASSASKEENELDNAKFAKFCRDCK